MATRLRPVRCKRCDRCFNLCRSCDRGQRYCSDDCRYHGHQKILQKARRKYANSEKGKQNNRERQRRWRKRMLLKLNCLEKKVTDPSSQQSDVVVCLSHENKRFDESGRAVQGVIKKAKNIFAESFYSCVESKDQPEKKQGTSALENRACCYECGRPGVIVRKRRRRGRFRWIGI